MFDFGGARGKLVANRESTRRVIGSRAMRCGPYVCFLAATALACSTSNAVMSPSDAGHGDVSHPGENLLDAGTTSGDVDGGNVGDAAVPANDAADAASGCSPGNVAGFAPQWISPMPLHQAKCSGAQIGTLIDCLFNANANVATCDAFFADANALDCQTCAVTGATEPSLGPLVISIDGLVTLNVAGCIARTSNQLTATGCGAKVAASSQCASAACDANCPVPDGDAKALDARNKCQRAAIAGACSSYQKDAETCSTPLLQTASAACGTGSNFTDIAINMATLFCGN